MGEKYRALLNFKDGFKLIRPLTYTENKQYMPLVTTTRDENIHLNIRLRFSHYDHARKIAVYHEEIPEGDGPQIA